jgi:hypothetical protein
MRTPDEAREAAAEATRAGALALTRMPDKIKVVGDWWERLGPGTDDELAGLRTAAEVKSHFAPRLQGLVDLMNGPACRPGMGATIEAMPAPEDILAAGKPLVSPRQGTCYAVAVRFQDCLAACAAALERVERSGSAG